MYNNLMDSNTDQEEDNAIAAISTMYKTDEEIGEEIQAQAKK